MKFYVYSVLAVQPLENNISNIISYPGLVSCEEDEDAKSVVMSLGLEQLPITTGFKDHRVSAFEITPELLQKMISLLPIEL